MVDNLYLAISGLFHERRVVLKSWARALHLVIGYRRSLRWQGLSWWTDSTSCRLLHLLIHVVKRLLRRLTELQRWVLADDIVLR